MKKITFLIMISMYLSIGYAQPLNNEPETVVELQQPSNAILTEVISYIKVANIKELSKNFNTTIDLLLPSVEGSYSKTQAELILKDFFEKNPPKNLTVKHQGSSNDGSLYAIGTYSTDKLNYRTYILLKKINDKYLIHQLQFEQE